VTLLSPAKLLVVLVVAVIVLGPDKLPKVARQVGTLWGDFRRLRQRLETDVRGNFPDLPSTERITQAVRSPIWKWFSIRCACQTKVWRRGWRMPPRFPE